MDLNQVKRHRAFLAFPVCFVLGAQFAGCSEPPEQWSGPALTSPQEQIPIKALRAGEPLPFIDMSFFARPAWGDPSPRDFARRLSFAASPMIYPIEQPHRPGDDVFPAFELDFLFTQGELRSASTDRIDTSQGSESAWDVFVGHGMTWSEPGDAEWSRAAFPINLTDRIVGSVRNCVATFAFNESGISNTQLQCSQETADQADGRIGNIRALVATSFGAIDRDWPEMDERDGMPTRRLEEFDRTGEIARYFDRSLSTNASTSIGAVYFDGVLYVSKAKTRHGTYPYPDQMRHGVYSVSKSLTGSLAMFYLAERYGPDIFDEKIADHVPELAGRSEWSGVTFGHALNMATGTNGSDELDYLLHPVMLASSKQEAIGNIAKFGGTEHRPGTHFNYSTSNYFVLSLAIQNFVEEREGSEVLFWDLLKRDVLEPIGAGSLDVTFTRDPEPEHRIPVLGYGARPTLDEAARIARLIADEGEFAETQILNRQKVREALGRTPTRGLETWRDGDRYHHGFWSRPIRTESCEINVVFMEGFGSNHIIFLPSGAIIFRFMDEFELDMETLVRAVEAQASSCAQIEGG